MSTDRPTYRPTDSCKTICPLFQGGLKKFFDRIDCTDQTTIEIQCTNNMSSVLDMDTHFNKNKRRRPPHWYIQSKNCGAIVNSFMSFNETVYSIAHLQQK